MQMTMIMTVFAIIVLSVVVSLFVLIGLALVRFLRARDTRGGNAVVRKSLGETIQANRIHCNMTQEFVAETLGVSRQAVSKWENGASDPSTSNLLALAKLFGVSAEELLKGIAE